ncbi:MAG: hypothetical protein WCX77_01470 [Candidatus Paceibacterota bacterium]|jgi:hypothetical protein
MDDFKKIKEAIYGANRIAILTHDDPSQDAAGAALALFFSLKNINKIVNIPSLRNIPEPIALLARKEEQKTFLISLKKNVSEIYYEKKDGEVKLYIKSKKESIKLEDFSFGAITSRDIDGFSEINQEKKPADLLISLGIENFQTIEKTIEKNPDQYLPQIKIINIDNRDLNQKYADFNLVEKNSTLSQSCAHFLKNFGSSLVDKDVSNALLYGFASFLKGSKQASRQGSILFLSWLAKNGADFSLWADEEKEAPKQNLLAETFKKIEFCGDAGFYCSALAEKDFESAGASPKDLGFVISKIKTRLFLPSFLLLWKAEAKNGSNKIMGIFYSDKEEYVEKMNQYFEGRKKGTGLVFLSRQSDLASAKKEALNAIGRQ